jgi:hypothetical protein
LGRTVSLNADFSLCYGPVGLPDFDHKRAGASRVELVSPFDVPDVSRAEAAGLLVCFHSNPCTSARRRHLYPLELLASVREQADEGGLQGLPGLNDLRNTDFIHGHDDGTLVVIEERAPGRDESESYGEECFHIKQFGRAAQWPFSRAAAQPVKRAR